MEINLPQPKLSRTSWSRIAGFSFIVMAIALATCGWINHAIELLLAQFFYGAAAGWGARRHGWLSGVIVGLPLALFQLSRLALVEYGSTSALFAAPDYWRLVVPTAVASTGMAIMGGIAGAFFQDIQYQRSA